MFFEQNKQFNFNESDTPSKIKMEPKNKGLEDDFPFQTGDFQVSHITFLG